MASHHDLSAALALLQLATRPTSLSDFSTTTDALGRLDIAHEAVSGWSPLPSCAQSHPQSFQDQVYASTPLPAPLPPPTRRRASQRVEDDSDYLIEPAPPRKTTPKKRQSPVKSVSSSPSSKNQPRRKSPVRSNPPPEVIKFTAPRGPNAIARRANREPLTTDERAFLAKHLSAPPASTDSPVTDLTNNTTDRIDSLDLFSWRFVRWDVGRAKQEAWCGNCSSWHETPTTGYQKHLEGVHGVSIKTGRFKT